MRFTSQSRRRCRRLIVLPLLTVVAAAGAFVVSNASAVHDVGLFQLDGDAVDFYLCQPAQVTAAGCSTGETRIGATPGGNLAGSARFRLFDSLAECQSGSDVKYRGEHAGHVCRQRLRHRDPVADAGRG